LFFADGMALERCDEEKNDGKEITLKNGQIVI
jgi:hypothetical protein